MVTHKFHSVTSEEVALSSVDCPGLKQLAENKKVRITPLRERVYHFVRHAKDKGISAYQILELMKKDNPNAKPSTVYRSLDYLVKTGIIVKIECCSKFVRKKHLSSQTATLFMICATCGTIIQHVDEHIHSYIENNATEYGCTVYKKDMEIWVTCPDCRVKQSALFANM